MTDYGEYEVQICENCKHNEYFNWLDVATMKREYDSKCSKGLNDGIDVLECDCFEKELGE